MSAERSIFALILCIAGCAGAPERGLGPTVGVAGQGGAAVLASPPALVTARKSLADDRPGAALSTLNRWLESAEAATSPWTPEALYLRGNAKLMAGDEDEALFDYEQLVKEFPGSDFFVSALERELDVAKLYFAGKRRPVLGVRIDSGAPVAEEIVVRIAERLPGSPLAEQALLELADYYVKERDLKMAAETYDVFARMFPRSGKLRFAQERRLYSTIAQYKGPRYNPAILTESRIQAWDFARDFPEDARRAGIDEAMTARLDESAAASLLSQGKWYIQRGDGPSARVVLARTIRTFPTSAAAQEAVEILGTLAQESEGTEGTR